jgi:hypothetical protein
MTLAASAFLAAIPDSLRDELFFEFNKILKNYREGRWEPAELSGGKICEVIYTILDGYISGKYPNKATKPQKFFDACKALENADPIKFSKSVRVQIPRILVTLYDIRNNRGVGHVGGDVNPNHMDATLVVYGAKWLMAELIRIFHNIDVKAAAETVESLIQKESPIVWDAGHTKRVLKAGFDFKEQTLLLLYSCIDGIAKDEDLFGWVEYSRKDLFKANILKKLHDKRLIEYRSSEGTVKLSPTGIQFVEDNLLK